MFCPFDVGKFFAGPYRLFLWRLTADSNHAIGMDILHLLNIKVMRPFLSYQ